MPLTAQEIFTKAKDHLLSQMKRSNDPGRDMCLYRYNDGESTLKCAAGALIPDEVYESGMDSGRDTSWMATVKAFPKLREIVAEEHDPLVAYLQHLHDAVDPEKWETELKALAKEFGLNF